MKGKWLGVLLSVVLAALGTFVLVRYVQSAEERALEGEETVEVLVVSEAVAKGTSAEALTGKVASELVPVKVQAPGSVASLAGLEGMVAAVDLVPGEQLLASRFVTAQQLAASEDFAVPDGLLTVTVALEPERLLGGELYPGDFVAVVASFDPFDLDATLIDPDAEDEEEGTTEIEAKTPNSSHIIVHKALVTNVQVEEVPTAELDEAADQAEVKLAPTGNLLVTLGMEAPDIERYVFTAEFGKIWLAKATPGASEDGTQIQTRGTVYLPDGVVLP